MATTIDSQSVPGAYANAGLNIDWTAADNSGGNRAAFFPGMVVLAWNSDPDNPHDVTITSVADSEKRTGDIVDTVAVGEIHLFGPFLADGWRSNGYLNFSTDNALVLFAVLDIRV